ncbi:MAG: hypothetical protein ACTSQI_08435 [Candidatus Helarchaeota archaeon]
MTPKENKNEKITYVSIYIHDPKLISETKENTLSKSSGIIRTRGLLKKEKQWTTLSYMIPIQNLGIDENTEKREILERLLNPYSIINKETKNLIIKLLNQYGPIKSKGRNKLEYKTERFKKKWKMKTRRVGGI